MVPKQTWTIRGVLRDFQCQKANSGKCSDYSACKESTIKMTITSPILQFVNFSSAPTILKHLYGTHVILGKYQTGNYAEIWLVDFLHHPTQEISCVHGAILLHTVQLGRWLDLLSSNISAWPSGSSSACRSQHVRCEGTDMVAVVHLFVEPNCLIEDVFCGRTIWGWSNLRSATPPSTMGYLEENMEKDLTGRKIRPEGWVGKRKSDLQAIIRFVPPQGHNFQTLQVWKTVVTQWSRSYFLIGSASHLHCF